MSAPRRPIGSVLIAAGTALTAWTAAERNVYDPKPGDGVITALAGVSGLCMLAVGLLCVGGGQ